MTNPTPHGQVPEALRIADEFKLCSEYDTKPSIIDIEKAEDAARYRCIRRGQHWSVIDGIGNELRAEALDTAIDAAHK